MGFFGSKATPGLCQALIALMPPHSVYIESHLGGGALMKRKPPAERSIGIDRDVRVLEAFACAYPVERVHGCAHEFLSCFPFRGPELVYSDPPYLHATRRSRRRYRFDSTEAEHVALLELLGALPCRVMVSGHPSALYDEQLAGWRRLSMQVMTQGIVRTEVVCSTSHPTGCTGRAVRAGTSPTASASSARPPTGAGATGRCRRAKGWRCWPPSWPPRPKTR